LSTGFQPGDFISYTEMFSAIDANLLNFRLRGNESVIPMGLRRVLPIAIA